MPSPRRSPQRAVDWSATLPGMPPSEAASTLVGSHPDRLPRVRITPIGHDLGRSSALRWTPCLRRADHRSVQSTGVRPYRDAAIGSLVDAGRVASRSTADGVRHPGKACPRPEQRLAVTVMPSPRRSPQRAVDRGATLPGSCRRHRCVPSIGVRPRPGRSRCCPKRLPAASLDAAPAAASSTHAVPGAVPAWSGNPSPFPPRRLSTHRRARR